MSGKLARFGAVGEVRQNRRTRNVAQSTTGCHAISLSRRPNGRENATEWLCRHFWRVVRADAHGRSFSLRGGRCAVPGELVVGALNRWARGTHDRHRPGPGRGTAGERRHGGAAGPRARRVHLPRRGACRGRGPAAAGRSGRVGQRIAAPRPGTDRRGRPPARRPRDGGPGHRLRRPRRRTAARAGPRSRAAAAPPAAPRPADPGRLRQPGPLPRRPWPRRNAGTAPGRARVPRRPGAPRPGPAGRRAVGCGTGGGRRTGRRNGCSGDRGAGAGRS